MKDELKSCYDSYLNKTFHHNDIWSRDPCTECECLDGIDSCTVIDCLPCEDPVKVQGQCCPKCLEAPPLAQCFDATENKTVQEGETWNKDACTLCTCSRGQEECVAMDCPRPTCDISFYIPGKCCPVCPKQDDTCFDRTLNKTFKNDESWKQTACTDCTCSNGEITCAAIYCDIKCSNPVYTEGECCPTCPGTCLEDDVHYEYDESWKRDDCTTCTCDAGAIICASHDCFLRSCKNPRKIPGQCCPVCDDINECVNGDNTYGNGKYICKMINSVCITPLMLWQNHAYILHDYSLPFKGESWTENNGCNNCMCLGGKKYCAAPVCSFPDCPDGNITNVEGICCPVCSTSTICKDKRTNRSYVEGNLWQEEKGCFLCQCTESGIDCNPPNNNLTGCQNVASFNAVCGNVCLDASKPSRGENSHCDSEKKVVLEV